MSEPAHIKSFHDLVAVLKESRTEIQTDEAEQALVLSVEEPDLGGKLIVRWEKTFPFVHIIQPMLSDVPADRAAPVALAICRLNNVAKFAGLGYDESARVIYYRITLVTLRDGIRSDLLNGMLHGAVANAKELLGAMKAVVSGAAPEGVVALAGA